MTMKKKQIHLLFSIVSFSLTLLLIFTLFGNFSPSDYRYFFSSDTLYLPSIYQDLFVDGYSLQGWELNPAPNVFPDMIVYFILMGIVNGNFLMASILYAILQYFAIFFLVYKIARFKFGHRETLQYLSLGNLFLCLFFSCYFEEYRLQLSFQLLSNSYHLGAFMNTLIAVYLILLYLFKNKKWVLPILFLLVFIAGFSDKLFIVQFIGLGLLVFSIAWIVLKRKLNRKLYWVTSISVVASTLSILVFTLIPREYISFGTPYSSNSSWEQKVLSIKNQFFHILEILVETWSGFFIVILLVLSFIILVYLNLTSRKEKGALFWISALLLVYLLGSFFIPALTGSYIGFDCIRYNINVYILGLISIPFLISYFPKLNRPLFFALPFILIFSVILLQHTSSLKAIKDFNQHYPETTETLDQLKSEYHLKNGVSEYWYAKFNTMFSRNELRIYSTHYSLRAYFHVTNSNWYFQNPDGSPAIFNYVIVENEITMPEVIKHFDTYQVVKRNGLTICITPDFIFNKESEIPQLLD